MTETPANARTRALIPPRWVMAGAALAAAATGLLEETLATWDRPSRAVIWGAMALAAYSGSLLCLVGGKSGAGVGLVRWRFGPWTLLWYGAAFGLATVIWSQPQTGTPVQIAVPSVLQALWLVAVGMTFWALGYFVGPGQPVRGLTASVVLTPGRRFAADVRSPAAPWILYAIGVAARVVSTITTGLFGYVGDVSSAVSTASGYGQILGALSLCAPLAIAAAALQAFRERLPGARITLAILFLIEFAFGAAAGGKENFIIAVLAVVIPFSTARRRLPARALISAVLVFLVVVIPFNQVYRSTVRSGSVTLTPAQAIDTAPAIFEQTLSGHDIVTVLGDSVDYLMRRIREIDGPAIILQRTPGEIPFRSPAELIEAPIAGMVPRAIWPGKPILDVGYQFSQQYYGLPATVYTSSAVTPVGDLYRHGGWLPVVAGMFLLGCGMRLLDDVLDVRTNPHAIFLVLLLFTSLVKGETDWVSLLAGLPATLAIWLLAVALTFRIRRPT